MSEIICGACGHEAGEHQKKHGSFRNQGCGADDGEEICLCKMSVDEVLDISTQDNQLIALRTRCAELEAALKRVELTGGNLPDERFLTETGPKDAAYRGGLFVSCREIARAALLREGRDA